MSESEKGKLDREKTDLGEVGADYHRARGSGGFDNGLKGRYNINRNDELSFGDVLKYTKAFFIIVRYRFIYGLACALILVALCLFALSYCVYQKSMVLFVV